MQKKQFDRVNVNLLNAPKTIPAKVSTHLKSHGRHYMILATAVCILAAYTVALTGCRSSTNPPKYSVEEMAREKHKSRSSGSR